MPLRANCNSRCFPSLFSQTSGDHRAERGSNAADSQHRNSIPKFWKSRCYFGVSEWMKRVIGKSFRHGDGDLVRRTKGRNMSQQILSVETFSSQHRLSQLVGDFLSAFRWRSSISRSAFQLAGTEKCRKKLIP